MSYQEDMMILCVKTQSIIIQLQHNSEIKYNMKIRTHKHIDTHIAQKNILIRVEYSGTVETANISPNDRIADMKEI